MQHSFLSILTTTASCSLLLMTGCGFENPFDAQSNNGSQTIVVNAQSVGQLAMATMKQSQDYSTSFNPAEGVSAHLSGNQSTIPSMLKKGMAKMSAPSISTENIEKIDSSDITKGIIRFISANTSFGYSAYDTLEVSATNLNNWIRAYGSKVYSSKVEAYRLTDADGDGIINGAVGTNPKAHAVLAVTYTKATPGHYAGETEKMILTGSAGPDNNFDTENDNVVYETTWVRLLGTDTLAYAQFSDADADGYIIDNGSTQKSVVDVALFEKDPAFRPFVDYSRLNVRIITDGNDSNDVVIKLQGEERFVSGRVNTIAVIDTTGDSVISKGEIAEAIFATIVAPTNDSIIHARASVVFDPVSGIQHEDDNLYYELHLFEEKRFGVVRKMTFDFTTKNPVASGQDPSSGHLEMSVTFANDQTASVVADFDRGYFSGTYTAPDGSMSTVTWNAEGTVVAKR